jgi:hypothetical protein
MDDSNWWNEWVAVETEVLAENLPQCRSVYRRSQWTCLGIELRPVQRATGA